MFYTCAVIFDAIRTKKFCKIFKNSYALVVRGRSGAGKGGARKLFDRMTQRAAVLRSSQLLGASR